MAIFRRIFYASSGPGDIIESHDYWKSGGHNPSEVSITFSGQIEQFCKDMGAKAYFVSMHPDGKIFEDGDIILEHRPKSWPSGWRYHVEDFRYCLGLIKTARQFGAELAILDSGTVQFYTMTLFHLFGISVLPVLHNTQWAAGCPSMSWQDRTLRWLNGLFWRFVPKAVLAVSPEAERQVKQMAPKHKYPILQFWPQFRLEYFEKIQPAPAHHVKPFMMTYVGRADENKGIFDIPVMARAIEQRSPGLVKWTICGGGPDLERLRERVKSEDVEHIVDVRGWTSPADLIDIHSMSHASIVPTRSTFAEGLAMTAVEAILAKRPLITNPVVPAFELLQGAALIAKTDDPQSYASAVFDLATDQDLYERLRAACNGLETKFYDRNMGLTAKLKQVLATADF